MLLEVKNKILFDNLVIESERRVVLLYWWSPKSRLSQSALYKVADIGRDLGNTAVIGLINADNHAFITHKYNINNIPTLVAFKNGRPVDRFFGIGLSNEHRIMQFIENSIYN